MTFILHSQHKFRHGVVDHPRVRQSLFEGHVLKPNGSGQHPRARKKKLLVRALHPHLMTMRVQGWQDRPAGPMGAGLVWERPGDPTGARLVRTNQLTLWCSSLFMSSLNAASSRSLAGRPKPHPRRCEARTQAFPHASCSSRPSIHGCVGASNAQGRARNTFAAKLVQE